MTNIEKAKEQEFVLSMCGVYKSETEEWLERWDIELNCRDGWFVFNDVSNSFRAMDEIYRLMDQRMITNEEFVWV